MKTIVATRSGQVEGRRTRGVLAFRGIPYARPPVGDLRFRAPKREEPWQGVRPADRFGPAAPQSPQALYLIQRLIGTGGEPHAEDCLYLNVWTPAADHGRRPVMVWIHGGAFIMGSGSTTLYKGARLAARGDVVVVTINYRLGALGFLNHPELSALGIPSNLGLRDQIAALEWVRDNIEAFGGDPENVTIFGESAGGMSVGTLLGTPAAAGLFRRAIPQSGAAHNVSSGEQGAAVAELFLSGLDLTPSDWESLGFVSGADLLYSQRAVSMEVGIPLGILAWQPSIDGDLLPDHPLDAIANGLSRSVSVLIGSNRDEWKLFMLGDRKGHDLDEDGLRRRFARVLPGDNLRGTPHVDVALETYRGAIPDASATERWVAFQSDRIFHFPAIRLAELQSAHNPETFRYLFSWTPPLLSKRLGSCHGLEIPFVFGTLRDSVLRASLGMARDARRLSSRMQDAWTAFARTGNPGHDRIPDWPGYDVKERAMLVFDSESHAQRVPVDERRDFWASHLYAGPDPERSRGRFGRLFTRGEPRP
jgi:para-nitrobenzyl esterase